LTGDVKAINLTRVMTRGIRKGVVLYAVLTHTGSASFNNIHDYSSKIDLDYIRV